MRRFATASAIVGLTLTASVLTSAFAGMDEGISAYNNGDYASAFGEFEALADAGDIAAQYNVAQMYRKGQGVAQNYPAAIAWYEKAAEAGLSSAQNNLAQMYADGDGGEVDYESAVRWWQRAARQDHVGAQFNVGVAYHNGFGVAADPLEALFWYSLAMVNGYVGARPIRERLAATLSVEQLVQITERVHNWQPATETLRQ